MKTILFISLIFLLVPLQTTVLDSIVYICIDELNNCLAGVEPDSDIWEPSSHPAEIVGEGEVGMANPLDDIKRNN